MKYIYTIGLAIIGLSILLGSLKLAEITVKHISEKNRVYECAKLKQQSETLKDFYYTDWQIEMCNV